jgi:hypothetical protein
LPVPTITRDAPQTAMPRQYHRPNESSALRVRYPDGQGILRDVLKEATTRGFAIDDVATEAIGYRQPPDPGDVTAERRMVEVTLHVHGKGSINDLAAALSEQANVEAVLASDANTTDA